MAKLEKYNPKEAEPRLWKWWEDEGIYLFDPKSKKPIFSIDTPPPTVSGKMHIGHAFSYAHMDFIARYKRMRGFNLFYPFGTDDNGLATMRLVEREKGISEEKMSRQEYIDVCLKHLEEIRPGFIQDWKNIGISADYTLFYTTISDYTRKVSQKSFLDLHKKKRVYQKEDATIWCPTCRCSIAQVEMKDTELYTTFNDVVFKLEDGKELIIATTRPELLPSCVAIFAHPDDKRYKKLFGKKAQVPLFDMWVPILPDERADPEKGTGIVMCCTFGDQTDVEWYRAHNLPCVISITEDGKMNEKAGKYKGLSLKQARIAIKEDLEANDLLKKEERIKHTVNVHERCSTEIEILPAKTWSIKYLDLKEKFFKAAKKLNWYPPYMKNRLDNWIDGLQWDWNLSRQRFFGVPIPVWYCKKCGEVMLPNEKDLPVDPLKDKPKKKCKCGSSDFEPEKDVLDTWATSSLTPQIAAGLVPKRYDDIYPMSLRPQAHDIITFWLFNTMVKAQLHGNVNPWKDAMISGWALDPHGKKMSKSAGNVIDPQEMLDKYSADALRYWSAGNTLGEDLPFKEKDLATGIKLVTKIFNASKFVLMHLEGYDKMLRGKRRVIDKWLLSKLNRIVKEATETFDEYEFSKARKRVENFFWHMLCDNYLEIVKDRLYNPDKFEKGEKEGAQLALYETLLTCLKLLAPIMPYITEEIFQTYFSEKEKVKSIHISKWPEYSKTLEDEQAEATGDLLLEILVAVRQFKQEHQMSLGAEIDALYINPDNDETQKKLEMVVQDLKGATRAKEIKLESGEGEEVETEAPVKIKIAIGK